MKNGYIIPNAAIAVDYWHVARKPFVRFFFLTHCHADHTDGLTNTWRRRIYCSPLTAKLASQLLKVKADLFIPIEVDETVTIDYDDDQTPEKRSFHVTALDADHCPGAVMFLFDGWFGRILCTGDFRYEMNADIIDVERLSLHPIDSLYLDGTNYRIDTLPERSGAIEEVLRIIEQRPRDEVILLAMPQSRLGKEKLLTAIAARFGQRICVEKKRLEVVKILEMAQYFTDDTKKTRFHVVGSSIGKIAKSCYHFQSYGNSVFVLILTSLSIWRGAVESKEENACRNLPFDDRNTAVIPYSDHSSREEIDAFRKFLNVKECIWTGCENTVGPKVQRRNSLNSGYQVLVNYGNNQKEEAGKHDRANGCGERAEGIELGNAPLENGADNSAFACEDLEEFTPFITNETNLALTDEETEALLAMEFPRLSC